MAYFAIKNHFTFAIIEIVSYNNSGAALAVVIPLERGWLHDLLYSVWILLVDINSDSHICNLEEHKKMTAPTPKECGHFLLWKFDTYYEVLTTTVCTAVQRRQCFNIGVLFLLYSHYKIFNHFLQAYVYNPLQKKLYVYTYSWLCTRTWNNSAPCNINALQSY